MPNSVYYSVCPFGTADIKTGSPTLTIVAGVATLSVAQTGNIGMGCRITYDTTKIAYISGVTSSTVFSVVTALGATPSAEATPVTVNSIAHEYASLNAFDSGYTDANHINNASLVSANVAVFACCYYDHNANLPDSTRAGVNSATAEDATRYLTIFTPRGMDYNESINNQRHDGKWASGKYRLEVESTFASLEIEGEYNRVIGLQIKPLGTGNYDAPALGIGGFGSTAPSDCRVEENIMWADLAVRNRPSGTLTGINMTLDSAGTIKIASNIIYDFYRDDASGEGIDTSYANINIYNNTIVNCDEGIDRNGTGDCRAINNVVQDTIKTDSAYVGTFHSDSNYNVSDDDSDTGGANDTKNNNTVGFVNRGSDDFHLDTSDTVALETGTNLTADANYPDKKDIDGETRPASGSWCRGADEEVVVAAGNPYYYFRQQA